MPTRWWVQGVASPELEALQADPDQVLAGTGSVARERVGRKRFYRLDGSPALYVKIFTAPSGMARLETWLRPSRARREARVARAVTAAGFDAAVPVAVAEERTALGLLRRAFVITEERPARDLRSLLLDPSTDRKRRRELVESFGALNRALHDAGVDQDDTSPNNFLIDAPGHWTLIDFERCAVGSPLRDERRWTLVAKLQRHELGVSKTDRLRFLRTYLGRNAGREERRRLVEKTLRALADVRRNDARRAAAGAFQPGRNVARDGSTWWVKSRAKSDTVRVDVPAREARRLWVLAHQLERLKLPALRPVRLSPEGLELEAPSGDAPTREAVERARRTLKRHGALNADPEWALHGGNAVLCNLDAYELRL